VNGIIDHQTNIGNVLVNKMISYILVGMALLFARIAPLSEWNYRPSNKHCKYAQMTLDELYNKSHEGFLLRKCQENALIGLKP
jgi:hypothetical protein